MLLAPTRTRSAHEAMQPLPDALASGLAHIGTAEVAYQRNELDTARQHAGEGVGLCRQSAYTPILSAGLGLATQACVHQAIGDHAAARDLIAEAVRVGPSTDVVDLLNPIPPEEPDCSWPKETLTQPAHG